MKIVFVTGGSRSGKSSFALNKALKIKGKRAFIATATPSDDEMSSRINAHKAERGDKFVTFEEPLSINKLLSEIAQTYNVILIDCLTLWLSNIMYRNIENMYNEIDDLIESLNDIKKYKNLKAVYIVSNEVGMGIVPENKTARYFRDASGKMNQNVAAIADEVYFTVSGIAMKIK